MLNIIANCLNMCKVLKVHVSNMRFLFHFMSIEAMIYMRGLLVTILIWMTFLDDSQKSSQGKVNLPQLINIVHKLVTYDIVGMPSMRTLLVNLSSMAINNSLCQIVYMHGNLQTSNRTISLLVIRLGTGGGTWHYSTTWVGSMTLEHVIHIS